MRRLPRTLLAAAALAAGPAGASPRLVASFDDPAGDATGPGSYVPPGDDEFTEGDFDLRRFAVLSDGEEVVFEVTLGAPIRTPRTLHRTNVSPLPLWNGIYLQNVDIYIDADRSPGGFSACIPGRRVAFAGGRTWEAAVVLTPQPGPARAVTEDALGEPARHVFFAERVESRGRTLVARVPAFALGGPPREDWGYAVHVSGAAWERSFALVDRLRGAREADAFTMPVLGLREAWAFGGAPAGEAHPRVVDVLLPEWMDQKAVLGSFDAAAGTFARVPFVEKGTFGRPPPLAATPTAPSLPPLPASLAPTAPAARSFSVVDVAGDVVTLAGPAAGLRPMQLGRVLGPDGETVALLVVVRLLEGGLVASAVEGRERIAPGAAVRFDPPAGGRP